MKWKYASLENSRWCFTSRYFLTQSRNTTLDFSSSNWDLSLVNIGLHSGPFQKTCTVMEKSALYIYNNQNFIWALEWLTYLCFFPLVVAVSGRNFLFSSDFSFQLQAAAVAPDQRKWHRNQKVLKKNSMHLFWHYHSFSLHLDSRAQYLWS